VLFIAGTGRSGSTLLERMLGQIPGSCSLGEVVHLWERGILGDQRCGCGLPFGECPFWSRVGMEAFGGWGEMGSSTVELKRRVDRHRYIPLMLWPGLSRSYARDLEQFAEILIRLYRTVADVSGSSVVVDSSKSSSYVVLLRRITDLDLRLIHLVRDSRGVAYSATKRVERPEVVRGRAYMPRYHPARSALEWDAYNTLFEMVRASRVPSLRLRYEDLLDDPRRELTRVLDLAGLDSASDTLDFVGEGVTSLRGTHTISGNPMRFTTGDVQLRLDEAWKERLSPGHRKTVTLLTWPWMRRYGYDVRF
jgi:sulfotransferase family protein